MTRARPLTVMAVAAAAALLTLLGYGILSNGSATSINSALAAGERPAAPELRLPRLGSDATARLADWRGKVVVLNFWASWCGPCREESPMLQRWHQRIRRAGGTVLGVDVQDVTSDAQRFIREHRLTYPMLRDGEGDTAKPFEILGYPETLVIDRRGRIAAALRGPVDEAFLKQEIEPLLDERG
jgi:cytochrome c biogenesis protein CcmG, thiol:disulfide interchange protein DsbE